MERKIMHGVVLFAALLSFATYSYATGDAHKTLLCTDCHATQPVEGQPVDFAAGGREQLCAACHPAAGQPQKLTNKSVSLAGSIAVSTIVNQHSSFAAIPESMKQHMIQWLTERGYPAGDPSAQWYMSCSTCHSAHNATYPYLLNYGMESGELCSFCHGGTANTTPLWMDASARRVLYAPVHLGLVQADGVTELPAPPAPKDGDTVSGTVNFPLAAFTRFHGSTADIAYKIVIQESDFGSADVNPANHLYWYTGAEAVSWDTTYERNGTYTVSIVPYMPSTLAEILPLSFTLVVNNATVPDTICDLQNEISGAHIQNKGIENSLLAKASSACKAAQDGKLGVAKNVLTALLHEIEAQRGKQIGEAEADALIASINELLAQL